jgi:hypothetical protein
MGAEHVPRREIVTGSPRRSRPAAGYTPHSEIDEQTALGGTYVRSLTRSQLRAALVVLAALFTPALALPLVFANLPVRPGSWFSGPTLVWLVLGFTVHPALVWLAWRYVRRAERNERDFARLLGGGSGAGG